MLEANWFGQQKGERFEYHLLAIGLAVAVLIRGAGSFSIDGLLQSAARALLRSFHGSLRLSSSR